MVSYYRWLTLNSSNIPLVFIARLSMRSHIVELCCNVMDIVMDDGLICIPSKIDFGLCNVNAAN